jgi:hypothetical protein
MHRNRAVRRQHVVVLLLATLLTSGVRIADGFPVGPTPPPKSFVHEYLNAQTGHYFYTLDPAEIDAIETGAAGADWTSTGLLFSAYPSIEASGDVNFPTCDKQLTACVPVSRFRGTPGVGPDSYFLTADPAEAEFLERSGSGWSFDRVAFAIPVPDPGPGTCAAGLAPVYRLYNNRWMYNDSSHRYTPSDAVRSRMAADGWIDEGVVFCTYGSGRAPLVSHTIDAREAGDITTWEDCNAVSLEPRSCVALSNLPLPRVSFFPQTESPGKDPFNQRTGIIALGNPDVSANVALRVTTRGAAARDVFVQLTTSGTIFGLHPFVAPSDRPQYSSITPLQTLPLSTPAPGAADARLFPFRLQNGTEYELRLDFTPGVNELSVPEGSHAYGVAAITFADTRSGHRLRVAVLAFGTAPEADFVGRDAVDGTVLVATSFKRNSPFGRAPSGLTVHMQASYTPYAPYLDPFIWYVNRGEFEDVIDAARTADPELSPDPVDYAVASYGIKHEIFGSGEMGVYEYQIVLSLMPR